MAQEEIIFPNNIRNIRLANGMKMTELARQAGLSLSAVSKIEKGVRRLNQKQLLNICNILGCKLSDIFIKESDDAYIIKGMTPLEDIEDVVGISFDEEDYDTLNGYLISKLDRIPEEDEKIELDTDKGNFQVLSVEGNMIAEVRFVVRKEEEE